MADKIELETLGEQASKLFSLPSIVFQLQELLFSETSTIEQIAELISLDPALTARILRLANSSFYNFPAQIDTVTRAVTIVGTSEIYNLALATAAVSSFRGVDSSLINMPNFWKHSVQTGLIAKNLMNQTGVRNSEYVFVSGLLHNIGLLVVVEQYPDIVSQIDGLTDSIPSWEREQDVLGFTYAECSYQLLKQWNLPKNVSHSVRFQHQPTEIEKDGQLAAACIHIANRATSSMIYGENFDYKSAINSEAWELAEIDKENLLVATAYAHENVIQILGILSPESL